MRLFIHPMLAILSIVTCSAASSLAKPVDADILLTGGTIIDGAGGQPYEGNVAILGEKIVAVGDFQVGAAKKTIDCKGLVIAPGFIDLHNHSDGSILSSDTRGARCYLTQGCTTLVTGNCGGGREDIGKYYNDIAAKGAGINIAQLVPHGAVRDQVMGKVRRAPTGEERDKMKALAAAGMQQGAWGMSTGLQYVPGAYAKTDELIAIAQVVGQHGGIYASHIRDESDELIESIEEVIEIARGGHLPCHVSHFKASKIRNWGKVRAAARVIEEARKNGLTITADQYPYTASSTSIMAMLLPDEEREGGEAATSERLRDPQVVERLRPMVKEALDARGKILIASFPKKREWVGKLITDIAAAEGREPVEIGLELLSEPKAQGVNFGMDEADVRYVMTLPWVATASDGSSKIADGSNPHPRSFGTFSRKIGRYSIQEKVLPLAAAIRSATGLPADIIGFTDRGYLRKDLAADIVVFDPKQLLDHATYEKPFEESTGVRWLLVNGKLAITDGTPQDVLAGRPLRKNAKQNNAAAPSKDSATKQSPKATGGTQGVPPKSPQESLATMKVRDDLRIELVTAEPMLADPVAIDFGPDGKVWVAEMMDYGCKDGETCPPMGRITVLEDRDADGRFESSTTFLDKISMPMGVTVWRKGILISAAPDILYAEDTNGDGKADKVDKLLTGFAVENPHARVNTLSYGLDGWLYAALTFGSTVRSPNGDEFVLTDNDFRLNPDSGRLERETGRTQQGRVRDDWGNWFGCNNSVLCYHYPLSDRYLRRNPSVVPPSLSPSIASPEAARLYPRGNLVLFELSGPAGGTTAACGIGVYRDNLLGDEFSNNIFVCEPVNQLIHRMVPRPKGATFVGERAAAESASEFLTSTDNWFRPVQVRTGPDGALWIVDFYRYVLEHSRWIPKVAQEELDIYAGQQLGRIYRVVPKNAALRPPARLDQLHGAALAAAMDSRNGWQRDMVQQLVLWNNDTAAAEKLAQLAKDSELPATRLQALATLDLLGQLDNAQVERALADFHPAVRRQAVRIAESRLKDSPALLAAVLKLASEADSFVALQLASTLGETDDSRAVTALAKIARHHAIDPYVITAVLSSASGLKLAALLRETFDQPSAASLPRPLTKRLMELAGAVDDDDTVHTAINLAVKQAGRPGTHRFAALQAVFIGLDRNSHGGKDRLARDSAELLGEVCDKCASTAQDNNAELATRVDCLQVIGRTPERTVAHVRVLGGFLTPDHDLELQHAAIDALADGPQDEVAEELLRGWPTFTPSLRTRVLDVLLSRKEWVRALLDAVSVNSFAVADIDASHRARLAEHPDEDLRQLAATRLAATSTSSRAEVVDRYAKSLPAGDTSRGEAVYKKHCMACHEFRGQGNKVGPDIAALKDKTNDGLLREILDPNRAVDQRYAEYVAITTDGRVKNGILVDESSNAITLRGQQAEQTSLLRSELESLTSSGKSLMPEGFENQITPQDMADLLSFLASP